MVTDDAAAKTGRRSEHLAAVERTSVGTNESRLQATPRTACSPTDSGRGDLANVRFYVLSHVLPTV